jgi:hypothetical protein
MKPLLALALLVVLGFAAAGCGSSKKADSGQYQYTVTLYKKKASSGPIAVTGTTRISNVKTGTTIKYKGWPGRGVTVPPPGSAAKVGEVENTPGGTAPSSSQVMQLTHQENGSLTVSCTSLTVSPTSTK